MFSKIWLPSESISWKLHSLSFFTWSPKVISLMKRIQGRSLSTISILLSTTLKKGAICSLLKLICSWSTFKNFLMKWLTTYSRNTLNHLKTSLLLIAIVLMIRLKKWLAISRICSSWTQNTWKMCHRSSKWTTNTRLIQSLNTSSILYKI